MTLSTSAGSAAGDQSSKCRIPGVTWYGKSHGRSFSMVVAVGGGRPLLSTTGGDEEVGADVEAATGQSRTSVRR